MLSHKIRYLLAGLIAAGIFLTFVTDRSIAGARRRIAVEEAAAETTVQTAESSAAQFSVPSPEKTEGPAETEEETKGPGSSLAAPSVGGTYGEFLKKFQETERTLEDIKRNSSGILSGTARNEDAYAELRYWETQINALYQTIMDVLPGEEAAVLGREQQEWRKRRDETAAAAAKNGTGGTGESAEYILSQAESTKDRAYELLERYRDRLN